MLFNIFAQQQTTKRVDPMKNFFINEMVKNFPWLTETKEEQNNRRYYDDLTNRAFLRKEINASPLAYVLANTAEDVEMIYALREMDYYAKKAEEKRKRQLPSYDFLLDGVPVKIYKDYIQYGYKIIPYNVRQEKITIEIVIHIIKSYRF